MSALIDSCGTSREHISNVGPGAVSDEFFRNACRILLGNRFYDRMTLSLQL